METAPGRLCRRRRRRLEPNSEALMKAELKIGSTMRDTRLPDRADCNSAEFDWIGRNREWIRLAGLSSGSAVSLGLGCASRVQGRQPSQ